MKLILHLTHNQIIKRFMNTGSQLPKPRIAKAVNQEPNTLLNQETNNTHIPLPPATTIRRVRKPEIQVEHAAPPLQSSPVGSLIIIIPRFITPYTRRTIRLQINSVQIETPKIYNHYKNYHKYF